MPEVKEKKNFFANIGSALVGWYKSTKAEFKKIVWPTPQKILKDTMIVIVLVIILGAFISAVAWVFNLGVQEILKLGQ